MKGGGGGVCHFILFASRANNTVGQSQGALGASCLYIYLHREAQSYFPFVGLL